MTVYVITTGTYGVDLEVDQICETKEQADREAADLRKMGCEGVRIRPFADWAAAERYEDKVRGY